MMGQMIGRAIMDERMIDLVLNKTWWKIILNR